MTDVIIIGSGPAGVSASLYAIRAGLSVEVLSRGTGALEKAALIENYYGFAEPVSGAELASRGIAGARRLGVLFKEAEVVWIGMDDTLTHFVVETTTEKIETRSIILATGAARQSLPIPGLRELEGKGVSYCAICDAFFYRKKPVVVLGGGEYALHEAQVLLPVASSVTLCTNGSDKPADVPRELAVCTQTVEAVEGTDRVSAIRLADGSRIEAAGVFVASGVAGSADLARKIGAPISGSHIIVDDHMATAVPGLFAAGDATGGLLQIAKAVYEGAQAGISAAAYVRKRKGLSH